MQLYISTMFLIFLYPMRKIEWVVYKCLLVHESSFHGINIISIPDVLFMFKWIHISACLDFSDDMIGPVHMETFRLRFCPFHLYCYSLFHIWTITVQQKPWFSIQAEELLEPNQLLSDLRVWQLNISG